PMLSPIAATTQIVAALVRPVMVPRVCRMVPAPRNPMPVTTCAAIRPGSPTWFAAMRVERSISSAEPRQMRMLVRRPAGFPRNSRSRPIAPPANAATISCAPRSRRRTPIQSRRSAAGIEPHLVFHVADRPLRCVAGLLATRREQLVHLCGIRLQLLRARPDRREFRDHIRVQHLLAVDAAPLRAAAVPVHFLHGLRGREGLV